jgi:hypothetical protein
MGAGDLTSSHALLYRTGLRLPKTLSERERLTGDGFRDVVFDRHMNRIGEHLHNVFARGRVFNRVKRVVLERL